MLIFFFLLSNSRFQSGGIISIIENLEQDKQIDFLEHNIYESTQRAKALEACGWSGHLSENDKYKEKVSFYESLSAQ